MANTKLAGYQPAVFTLRDLSELEVHCVEMFEEEFEFKQNKEETLYALYLYLKYKNRLLDADAKR